MSFIVEPDTCASHRVSRQVSRQVLVDAETGITNGSMAEASTQHSQITYAY